MLNVFNEFELPISIATKTIAILASKGKGKSYCARIMAEEMARNSIPFGAIDPAGAWYGLPLNQNGKTVSPVTGNVVVFGGDHGQMPLPVDSGKIMGEALAKERFSAIYDLSLMRPADQKVFAADFFDGLYLKNREAIHLFVDEADEFAPQGDKLFVAESLARVVKRGRSRGIGVTMITQRPADISKSILTQCEVLLSMGMNHPRDIKPIDEWVKLNSVSEKSGFIQKLSTMNKGNGWLSWPSCPDGPMFSEFHVRKSETFDSGITPEVGRSSFVMAPSTLDVGKISESLRLLAEQAEHDDPVKLRAKIKSLETEAAKRQRQSSLAESVPVHIRQQEYERGYGDGKRESNIACTKRLELLLKTFEQIEGAANSAKEIANGLVDESKPSKFATVGERLQPIEVQSKPNPEASGPLNLGKCERKILTVVCQYFYGAKPGTRTPVDRVALIAGYRASGGGFQNAISLLRTNGLVLKDGDQLFPTEKGRNFLGMSPMLPVGKKLLEYWMSHSSIGKAERQILTVLSEFNAGATKDTIAELAGYEAKGGGFQNAISRLRTLGLIEKEGDSYKLKPELK